MSTLYDGISKRSNPNRKLSMLEKYFFAYLSGLQSYDLYNYKYFAFQVRDPSNNFHLISIGLTRHSIVCRIIETVQMRAIKKENLNELKKSIRLSEYPLTDFQLVVVHLVTRLQFFNEFKKSNSHKRFG